MGHTLQLSLCWDYWNWDTTHCLESRSIRDCYRSNDNVESWRVNNLSAERPDYSVRELQYRFRRRDVMANRKTVLVALGLFALSSATYGWGLATSAMDNIVQDGQESRWENATREEYALLLKTCLRIGIKQSRDHEEDEAFDDCVSELFGEHSDRPLEFEATLIVFLQNDYSLFAKDLAPEAWSRYRRLATELAIHAWVRIRASLDKDFDAIDKPFRNLAPPHETGLPSGVAPEAIKDPILRKAYEKALAHNAKKAEYYNKQSQLRKLDSDFSEKVERYLEEIYTRPPLAFDELAQLLDPDRLGKDNVERLLVFVRDKVSDK